MTSRLAIFVAIVVAAAGLTAGITGYLIITEKKTTTDNFMSSFSDYYELAQYLDQKSSSNQDTGYFNWWGIIPGSADQSADQRQEMGSSDYSKTNVQVQGVDEADIVKTDGDLIFIANWNSIAIIHAYPPSELQVLSYVNISSFIDNETYFAYIQGIYITEDRLIVVLSSNVIYYDRYSSEPTPGLEYSYWYYQNGNTVIAVFDVSDPVNPALEQTYTISGDPVTTRMIGNTVYAVSQFYVWKANQRYLLPEVSEGESTTSIEAEGIYYDPNATSPDSFMNIMAVNVADMKSNHITIIADYTSTVYMSLNALYLTFEKWAAPMTDVVRALSDDDTSLTTIYKIEVDDLNVAVTARGDVKGTMHNQFSLDERNGYLRVATTQGFWSNQKNAVYVLNGTLKIVGSLENIAPNESIYSARFVEDTLYLVTFRQIDPLFVIDLSDPTNPKILGEVEVTGFSTYLHPMDEHHILGIGIENGSVKISIFDVTDPTAPIEQFRYVVEGYSSSEANWDHKAILFDAQKELLVIPASKENLTNVDEYNYTYSYTNGAYVFRVSSTDGITLRAMIEHEHGYVDRSLYIGDYLYTISDLMVKVNLLSDLSAVNSIEYYSPQYYGYDRGDIIVMMQ